MEFDNAEALQNAVLLNDTELKGRQLKVFHCVCSATVTVTVIILLILILLVLCFTMTSQIAPKRTNMPGMSAAAVCCLCFFRSL